MNPHHHAAHNFIAAALGYAGFLQLGRLSKQSRLLERLDGAERLHRWRQEKLLRDAPIISKAEAKRERKRLKLMKDTQNA